jgi:hypothetical protein
MDLRSVLDMVLARSRRAASWPVRVVLWALGAVMTALLAILMFRRATSPMAHLPDNDYWANIRGLLTEDGITLNVSALFSHNNEHIVVIPKLVYVANYVLVSGSNVGLIAYSLAIAAVCVGLLLYQARDLMRDRPWRFLLCALLFPLAMFSPKLAHSYFLGMSGVIWLTANLFVILSAAALARAVSTERPVWLLLSLLAAGLGALTYSTAAYALLVLLICSTILMVAPRWRGAMPVHWLLVTAVLAAAMLTVGLIYRPHPAGHPPLLFELSRLFEFVLLYLGNALATDGLGPPAGGFILAAGAISIALLIVQGRAAEKLAWIELFLFAPFNAFMTGIGRAGFGTKAAEAVRYQSVTAISLIAAIALCLYALPRLETRRSIGIATGLAAALVLFAVGILGSRSTSMEHYVQRNERKAIAEVALRAGIESPQHLVASTPAAGQLAVLLPILRASGHVPFNRRTDCESLVGRHIAQPSGPPNGVLDTLTATNAAYGNLHELALSGWAVQRGVEPTCLVIIDDNRKAIGSGVPVKRRPDVERMKHRSLGLVGWEAVALAPNVERVCALAMFPNSRELFPLAHCKDGAVLGRKED